MITAVVRKCRVAADVLHAVPAVRRARQMVARTPLGSLIQPDAPTLRIDAIAPLPSAQRQVAARWGAAVDRALRWTPGDSACLVRASALRDLVIGRGLPRAVVRIGVRRGQNGFEAHAWVEQDGTAIAEPAIFQGAFTSIEGVTLR